MMPRLDGFEMVRRIRKTDDHTPVLFLTAKSTPDDVVTGFELGANDYLKKPFAIQELIIRIKALMGKAYMTEPSGTGAKRIHPWRLSLHALIPDAGIPPERRDRQPLPP